MLSFTAEVFFSLLGQYNRAIWPAQIFAGLLGLGAVLLAGRPVAGSDRVVAAILAAAWLWVAIAFHWAYLGNISFVAPVMAACFAAQAARSEEQTSELKSLKSHSYAIFGLK